MSDESADRVDLGTADGNAIEKHLNGVAGYLDGAVDFWTVVCLSQSFPSRPFLVRYGAQMQRLIDEARLLIRRRCEESSQPVALVEELSRECVQLQAAFLTLEQHRNVPLEAVRQATTAVAEVYVAARSTIQGLGRVLNVPIRYWDGRRADHEGYYRRILAHMYDCFCQSRNAGDCAVSPSRMT